MILYVKSEENQHASKCFFFFCYILIMHFFYFFEVLISIYALSMMFYLNLRQYTLKVFTMYIFGFCVKHPFVIFIIFWELPQ